MKITIAASLVIATSIFSSIACASVTMDWVTVGNAGNTADPLTGFGAVAYEYKIGKYEVTNAQYGAFLNAAAKTDSYGLYHSEMSSNGISQSGSSGNYTYSVTGALANRPVVFVSWFDTARFANWLANGQGGGSTETGAYTLNGATNGIILANVAAQVYIPSQNEWYKAAYYNGATSTYSLYPNGQNSITTADANYNSSGSTDVGTYSGDPSMYGTFDQGGNVHEWNDLVLDVDRRGLQGGAYGNPLDIDLASTSRGALNPIIEYEWLGFRVASVPEPTSMLLTMVAGGMMLTRRKR
jgi:formylglycine-generating enzyme required for sulfatase activity